MEVVKAMVAVPMDKARRTGPRERSGFSPAAIAAMEIIGCRRSLEAQERIMRTSSSIRRQNCRRQQLRIDRAKPEV
jgi:hypothetical protein